MQVSASFSQGTDITTVTVTNNALHQSTSLKLDGSYTASQFALSQDSGTGTLLKDPPLDPGMAAASHDSFDFAFDSNTALGSSSGLSRLGPNGKDRNLSRNPVDRFGLSVVVAPRKPGATSRTDGHWSPPARIGANKASCPGRSAA